MSYCRWSDDGFQCDVYAYEHCDGFFAVHVAAKRRVKRVPNYDLSSKEKIKETVAARRVALDDPENVLVDIGLPYDGQEFAETDLESLRDRLVMLRDAGYNVPQFAIDAVEEEIMEEQSHS